MWLHTDWAAANASCGFSITAEIWGKHEDSSRICVRITENGVFMKNWPPFCFRPPRGVKEDKPEKATWRPVIWVYLCDVCRRGESRVVPQSADWSFRGNHNEQRAENGPAPSGGLICELDYETAADPHLEETLTSANKTMTSQVRRVPPPCRQALTTSGRLIHSRSHWTGFCFTWRNNRWDLNPASAWTLNKTEWKHAGAKRFVSSWSGC